MIVKPPIAEHIRKDMVLEIADLLRKARFAPGCREAGADKPSAQAAAHYREALALVSECRNAATPKQLFMLLDMMGEFPHGEFGAEGGAICESLKDTLLEQYRRKAFTLTGWASE